MENSRKLLIVAIVFATTACEKVGDCFKSTGDIRVETRLLSTFDSLNVQDNVEVILVQDTIEKVIFEAGHHLLSELKAEVSNRLLLLKNENQCNWTRKLNVPIKAKVHFKNLSLITHKGVKTIRSYDTLHMKNRNLEIRTLSSGDFVISGHFNELIVNNWVSIGNVYLAGITNSEFIWNTGSSKVDARNLKSGFVSIHSDSPGSSYIYATDVLQSTITWTGNTYYRGDPTIAQNISTSSGRLLKID